MLQNFLNNKPLYYDKIDYTRMPRAYESIKKQLKLPKIIHIIGTNGKGTTGRFLAHALYKAEFCVGHYTSPHILEFNERIWLNGKESSDLMLEEAHTKLLTLLDKVMANELSYFEYTTLLAMVVFQECDYVVLEAGLGGEYDATAVFDNILTLITPIAKDHEAFLGTTIQEIATTKLNAIQTHGILGKQKVSQVYDVAETLKKKKQLDIDTFETYLHTKNYKDVESIAKKLHLSHYLQENLLLCISALNYLHVSYEKEYFHGAKLFGRLTQFTPNIILDVGHNVLAAQALLEALQGKKFVLVYNTYKDKEYEKILTLLSPIIKRIEIISIDDNRIVEFEYLEKVIKTLGISYTVFEKVAMDEVYLVFGSFSVVEAFLRRYENG